jgi:hypothetical protein
MMKRLIVAALALPLLSASAASAGGYTPMTDAYNAGTGTFRAPPRRPSMAPPRPPAPPAPPGYRSSSYEGGFKPWKPSVRVDSARGGVDAYPAPKKPRGYIRPY